MRGGVQNNFFSQLFPIFPLGNQSMPSVHRKAPPTQEEAFGASHSGGFQDGPEVKSAQRPEFAALMQVHLSDVPIRVWHRATEHFSLRSSRDRWTSVVAGEDCFCGSGCRVSPGLQDWKNPPKKQASKVRFFFCSPPVSNVPAAGLAGFGGGGARIASSSSACDSVILA